METSRQVDARICPSCGHPIARTTPYCRHCGSRLSGAAPAAPRRRYLIEPWWVGLVMTAGLTLALLLARPAAGQSLSDWLEIQFWRFGWPLGLPFLAGYYVRGIWPRVGCLGLIAAATLVFGIVLRIAAEGRWIDSYTGFVIALEFLIFKCIGAGFVAGSMAGGIVSLIGRHQRRSRHVANAEPTAVTFMK